MNDPSDSGVNWPSEDDDLSAPAPASVEEDRAFTALEAEVEANPGASGFPSLVEAYRRAGMAERGREIALLGLEAAPERLGGRVALALCLMDLRRIAEATEELASILENVPEVPERLRGIANGGAAEHPMWATPLADPAPIPGSMTPNEVPNELAYEEIDQAFESAEPDPEGMFEAAEAAQEALEAVGAAEDADDFEVSASPIFATATMAGLLESQGDLDTAEEIRSELRGPAERELAGEGDPAMAALVSHAHVESQAASRSEGDTGGQRRERIVSQLEDWLGNIRRKVA